MPLDKWIAVFFLVVSLIYGYSAYTYPLLPFERNMSFLPNTMPMGLSGLGVLLALIIIFSPARAQAEDAGADTVTWSRFKTFKWGQAAGLLIAMVLYALALRPLGFLFATTAFLVASGWILGERKPIAMVLIALTGAVGIWLIVQEALGIFLRPLPGFLS